MPSSSIIRGARQHKIEKKDDLGKMGCFGLPPVNPNTFFFPPFNGDKHVCTKMYFFFSLTKELHERVFEGDLGVGGEVGLEGGHMLGPGIGGRVPVEDDSAV